MEWTAQQKDIFEWFRSGTGNLVVRARAGTGKTTTIVRSLNYAPEDDILLAAFNKKIAKELGSKVQKVGGRADVKTLHGVGFQIVLRYWTNCQVDDGRGYDLAKEVTGDQAPDDMIRKVQKLAGLAKGMVVCFDANNPATADEVALIARAFDCEPDAQWQSDGWTTGKVASLAVKAMERARQREKVCRIDFDDMLFLPIANDWAKPRYQLIAVDEAQDMSRTQLELAQRVLLPSGRMAVVGDDRQAIYGFRGADSGALDRLKAELSAVEMGLTRTYRCGKVIVEYAKRIVPDFEAAPTNHEGSIESLRSDLLVETAAVGDFILSRRNAPLVPICLRLLRADKRARIEGKDVAAGLKSIAKRWKPKSIGALQDNISKWRDRETAKLRLEKTPEAQDKMEAVNDQADILLAICDGLTNPAELLTRLDTLFADSDDDRRPAVVCSSIHKAKGLEAKRVFVLRGTLHPRRKTDGVAPQTIAKRGVEESNLEYVAVTRAIDKLVWVDDD
jgi:superfamily I DNA/RNA helicase